ncbi:MAG: thermonuclease family protein [Cyanobacteria bacterium J06597_1]
MFKRCVLALATIGLLTPTVARAYGEPRVVPNYPFYFENEVLDQYPTATVVKVLSGNQVVVQVDGEPRLRAIELAGVRNLEAYAPEIEELAVAALEDAILHQQVRLEGDTFQREPSGTAYVQAYVWLHGAQMNEELVRNGLATVGGNTHYQRRTTYLRGVQDEAIAAGVGIWSLELDGRTSAEILESR